ncbi:MAG: glycosyltransferase family A protein [Bacteroidales bacterium]
MKLHIICAAYKRPIPLRIMIDCFIIQTNPNWQMYVIHDGPTPEDIRHAIAFRDDPRITMIETEEVHGSWGHPNRKLMLEKLPCNSEDFVLITNDDNYYVPRFVEVFLAQINNHVGFVFCDTVHSYMIYDVLHTEVKECSIDMGSFIVRLDIAKKVGFQHMHETADGTYAEECAMECTANNLRIVGIRKALYVHN